MSNPELDVVDVNRDGRWCQVLLMEASAGAQAGDGPYVGVVSADLGPDSSALLAALRPGLQEIVCFDSLAEPVVTGQDFAMSALEEGRFGQDFVFTVPALEEAVDHAVATLMTEDHGGWEGRFVVVVGPPSVLERAHRHLTEPSSES